MVALASPASRRPLRYLPPLLWRQLLGASGTALPSTEPPLCDSMGILVARHPYWHFADRLSHSGAGTAIEVSGFVLDRFGRAQVCHNRRWNATTHRAIACATRYGKEASVRHVLNEDRPYPRQSSFEYNRSAPGDLPNRRLAGNRR